MKLFIVVPLALWGAACAAYGQGLLSIGPVFDDGESMPLTATYQSALGWDSNPQSGYSGGGGGGNESDGSAFWQNSVNLSTRRGKPESRLTLDASYANTWYLNSGSGDDFAHNGRVGLSYARQFTRQFAVSNGFYASYQTDPDFDVGATVNRRTGGSLYLNNALSATYTWSHRIATVTGYAFSSVTYDDDEEGVEDGRSVASEDNMSHTFSQEFRYSFDRRTTLTASYRYNIMDYTGDGAVGSSQGDSTSHFFLLGGDRYFNRGFSISGSAGVQYREYTDTGDGQAAPYGEFAVNYRRKESRTVIRWHNRFGLDDTGFAARAGQEGGDGGYSYRTGITLNQQLRRRLSLNASANYIYQTFPSTFNGLDEDEVEQTVNATIGLTYQLRRRIGLNFNYAFTTVISDDPLQEYDRHRLYAGVTWAF
jgi:hypothetical protein